MQSRGLRALVPDRLVKAARILKNEGPASLVHKVMQSFGVSTHPEYAVQVLFVNGCSPDVPHPTRYRVFHQMEQLQQAGMTCGCVYYEDLIPAYVSCAEVVIFFRCPITDAVRASIVCAHEHGMRVYYDIDDLVIDTRYTDQLPFVQSMEPDERRLFDDGVMRNGETLKICDAAIASTGCLAEELSKYVNDVCVNRNVASQEMVTLSEKAYQTRRLRDDDLIVLGYFSGSLTHDADFALIADSLVQVFEARDNVSLLLVGVSGIPEQLSKFGNRISLHAPVDWRELPQLMASVDINLVPLVDTVFTRAKSENKWVDAALVGTPTIASKVGAFAEMIRNGETGLLCDGPDEWKNALLDCIDNQEKRLRIAERARTFCLARCTTCNTGQWLACKLRGERFGLNDLLPKDVDAKSALVKSYLDEYGMDIEDRGIKTQPWDAVTLSERVGAYRAAYEAGKKCALILYEMTCGDTPTFRYFGYNVWQSMQSSKTWHVGFFFVHEIGHLVSLLECTDAVVLVRMRIRPDVADFVTHAHGYNIPVAFLIDDLAVGPETAPRIMEAMSIAPSDEFGKAFWLGLTKRFEQTARLSDCFIAPIARLADSLSSKYGKPSAVIHNFLNDEQMSISDCAMRSCAVRKDENHPFTIAYFSGTDSHTADFALVEPSVIRFLNEYGDARLLLVGHLGLSQEMYHFYQEGQLVVLPPVDYVTLQCLQASADVSLAPVVLDEFTNCKSALKVFESAVVQTPVCASPSDAHIEAIEDGVTGFLCNNPDDWYRAFCTLYQSRSVKSNMGRRARDKATRERYGAAVCREIETALNTVMRCPVTNAYPPDADMMEKVNKRSLDWDDQLAINPLYGGLS